MKGKLPIATSGSSSRASPSFTEVATARSAMPLAKMLSTSPTRLFALFGTAALTF